jgi:hypothetical protein
MGAATHDMAGMDHSTMAGMDHAKTPGMQHSGAMAGMPVMHNGSPAAAPLVIAPPASNAAIARIQPAATLRGDEFDAPAPTAMEEAAKGASGSHSMEAMPKSPSSSPHDHTPQPQPPPAHHRGGEGEVS